MLGWEREPRSAMRRGLLRFDRGSAISYQKSRCRPGFLVTLVFAICVLLIVYVAPALAAPPTPSVVVSEVTATSATFATPASVTFNGPGNFAPAARKPAVKKKVKCAKPRKLSKGRCAKPKVKAKGKGRRTKKKTGGR
jgi:hypothetical protein